MFTGSIKKNKSKREAVITHTHSCWFICGEDTLFLLMHRFAHDPEEGMGGGASLE